MIEPDDISEKQSTMNQYTGQSIKQSTTELFK